MKGLSPLLNLLGEKKLLQQENSTACVNLSKNNGKTSSSLLFGRIRSKMSTMTTVHYCPTVHMK